jgi:hypothetical protein
MCGVLECQFMLSILKFSGKSWSGAAVGWILLAVAVDGLARSGAEAADAEIATYNTAAALGTFDKAGQTGNGDQYQVAKVAVSVFDPKGINPDGYGDLEDAATAR